MAVEVESTNGGRRWNVKGKNLRYAYEINNNKTKMNKVDE